ncbi:MAG: hypothetical protein AAF242_08255, partial [Bacteroidota bacterium]
MNTLTQKSPLWLIGVLLFLGTVKIIGQDITGARQLGNENLQSLTQLVYDGENTFWGGVFTNSLALGESTLQSLGEEDIIIAQVAFNLDSRPFLVGGSERDDVLTALAVDSDSNMVIAGSFWRSISFTPVDSNPFEFLHFNENPRALFLCKVNPKGQLLWHHIFRGGGIKMIDDITINDNGDIAIGGFFREELIVDGFELEKTGLTSGFTAFIRSTGVMEWVDAFGETGDTRVTALAFNTDTTITVTGWYNDTLSIGENSIAANTNDKDGYIAKYNIGGMVRWAHRAGGVFD